MTNLGLNELLATLTMLNTYARLTPRTSSSFYERPLNNNGGNTTGSLLDHTLITAITLEAKHLLIHVNVIVRSTRHT